MVWPGSKALQQAAKDQFELTDDEGWRDGKKPLVPLQLQNLPFLPTDASKSICHAQQVQGQLETARKQQKAEIGSQTQVQDQDAHLAEMTNLPPLPSLPFGRIEENLKE